MSKRQQVLDLVKEGKTTKEISKIIGLSIHGVRYHRRPGKSRIPEHRRRLKRKAIDYSGGSCLKCGYSKSNHAIVFHHLDPSEKDFNVNGNSISWLRTKDELDKTIILCHNCHHELHDNIWEPNEILIEKQNQMRFNYIDKPLKHYHL